MIDITKFEWHTPGPWENKYPHIYSKNDARLLEVDEYMCCTVHDAETGHYRACGHCGSDYAGAAELALNRRPCRCGPDGCSDSACAGRAR